MVTILAAGSARLLLETEQNEWCRMTLDLDGRRIELGSDTKGVILDRLRNALLDELGGSVSGILEGVEVRWVLSLAERHSTLYAATFGNGRSLYVQAEDGTLIGKIALSMDDMCRWRDELDRARQP